MEIKFFSSFVDGRKGEILDASLQVFREKGYANGSMRDIAKLVGITEPALYRHYKGKEDLFMQLISKAAERLVSEASQLLDEVKPEKINLSLENIFHDRKQAVKSYFPIMKTILLECFHNHNFLETFKNKMAMPMIKKLHQVFPLIDAYYGQIHGPEETRKRIRVLLSIFFGYFVSSIFIKENDLEAITKAITKAMDWHGDDHRFREDQFLENLPSDFNMLKKDELKKKIQEPKYLKQAVILDLRGKEPFEKDHIPGSLQMLIKDLPTNYKKLLPDKNKEIVVVCNGGMQSLYAVMYLQLKHYKNVKSLGGGFSKWKE